MRNVFHDENLLPVDSVVKDALADYEVNYQPEGWKELEQRLNETVSKGSALKLTQYGIYSLSVLTVCIGISYWAFSSEKNSNHDEQGVARVREEEPTRPNGDKAGSNHHLATDKSNRKNKKIHHDNAGNNDWQDIVSKKNTIDHHSDLLASVATMRHGDPMVWEESEKRLKYSGVNPSGEMEASTMTDDPRQLFPFSHTTGVMYYWGNQTFFPAVVYSSRLHILSLTGALSISLGSDLGLGVLSVSEIQSGIRGDSASGSSANAGTARMGYTTLGVDIEQVAELVFQLPHEPNSPTPFGAFFGLGLNVRSRHGVGTIIKGGVRTSLQGHSVEGRVSYIGNYDDNTIGVGIFYGLGNN